MKKIVLKTTALMFISLYFCTGCILNTKEDWKKLADRKFSLSEFQFVIRGQSREDAYNFYRKFPVKKIMFVLAREYNITIDISEFNNLINSKDLTLIEADGFIRAAKHTWKTKKNQQNRITLIFEQDYFDETIQKIKIAVYSNNSSIKVIDLNMSKTEEIFTQLKFLLKSGEESLKEYDDKKYDIISPVPLIIETESGSKETMEII